MPMVVTGIVTPLSALLVFGAMYRSNGHGDVAYLFSGAIVLALLFENLNKVAAHFSFLRETGALQYFASLPIRQSMLVVATVSAFLLLSAPSLAVTAIAGVVVLKVHLVLSPWLVLVLPLAVLPMAAVGAMIGTLTRSPAQSTSMSLLVTMAMAGIGGVMVRPELLPTMLQPLRWIDPAAYASSAVRQVLLGPVTGRLATDLAVLAATTAASFWLVARKLHWRDE
jgi:ABC-2 type transport system permease protein